MKVAMADMFWKSLKKLCRPWWHPSNLWYSFKCWAWKRFTTIKSRHLPHTWMDRTEVLPYTCFEILEQFIERECSPGNVEWYGEYGHKIEVTLHGGRVVKKYVRDEMQDLLDWWNKQYHGRYKKLEDMIWEEYHKLDDQHISNFSDDPDDPEAEWSVWDPKYATPEAKARADALLMWANYHERAVYAALYRRMHRLVNITPYLWT